MTTPAATVRELLQRGEARLGGGAGARLDCEVLLAGVLDRDRAWLYAHPEAAVDSACAADFNALVLRRESGYPLAYLTGWKEFWSLRLTVDRHTLIPRPETEHLVEAALALVGKDETLNILDLGTGTGAIAIALASERPRASVTATDVSRQALSLAAENAASHGLPKLRFVLSDWFSGLGRQRFDLIICNPPYVETGDPGFTSGEIRHEPRLALDGGPRGLDAYRRVIPEAVRHLAGKGYLLMEHGHAQGAAVRELFRHCHYLEITTTRDYAGHERITRASCPYTG